MSFVVLVLVLLLISLGFAATYLAAIASTIKKLIGGDYGHGRHLLDYSVGVSGASRLLEQNNYGFNDEDFEPDAKFFMVMIAIYSMWLVVISLVSSVFIGAFYHALGHIYTGSVPSLNKSISHGVEKMWRVYTFTLLYGFALVAMILFTIVPAMMINIPDFEHMGLLVISFMVFIISVAVIASLMAASIPSIVIERKSALQAFKRSYYLCKSYIGLIFCSQFCFNLSVFVVSMLINKIFDKLPGFLSLIGHLLVQIVGMAMAPIFCFVIYMSVRVNGENITQDEFTREIGDSDIVVADAVEMSETGLLNDNKGSYKNVEAAEMI